MGGAIGLALEVLKVLPGFVSAGQDIAVLVQTTMNTLKHTQVDKRDPSEAEWAAIHNQIDALRSALDAPE